ncbi:MAG: DNA adenine methylase [Helicobacteraceae bacterium]|nr:DNA adenine methylase [Helicobacteraceae bacterium]
MSKEKQNIPFLKRAGGKRELTNTLISFMPKNFNNYFEPFIGGGALFFALKNRNILENKNIFLSDKNTELINTYNAIKHSHKSLLETLYKMQLNHNKESYYKIRNLDRDDDFCALDSTFRAARFIYLNKTCFNGLCRHNSKGHFNTPMGSYKNPKIYDENLIVNANIALCNTKIQCCDFENIEPIAKSGDFVYFDPPYYPLNSTSSFVSYTDNFLQESQERLFRLFKKLDNKGVKMLLSNSNTEFIRELYKDFTIIEIQAKRAINCKGDKRGKITELLIKGNYE